MNADTSAHQSSGSGKGWTTVKRLLLAEFSTAVQAAVLFVASGRLDWTMAWVFVGVYAVHAAVVAALMEPELITERARIKSDAQTWDTVLMGLTKLFIGLLMPLLAGLDNRWGWTPPVPLGVQIAALVVVILGYGLGAWATVVNRFFSDVVRIQTDRGHTVISDGPYRYVRHPGYVGVILLSLATPFLLGSLWALVPGGLTVLLILVRTAFEDRTLLEQLDGYREYAGRVRYRLMPGVW